MNPSQDYRQASKEAYELYFRGLETGNRIARTWLDAAAFFCSKFYRSWLDEEQKGKGNGNGDLRKEDSMTSPPDEEFQEFVRFWKSLPQNGGGKNAPSTDH